MKSGEMEGNKVRAEADNPVVLTDNPKGWRLWTLYYFLYNFDLSSLIWRLEYTSF